MANQRKPHKYATPEQGRHAPYGWELPSSQRGLITLVAEDLRRLYLETDTGAVYELSQVSPPVWRRIDGARPDVSATERGYMTPALFTLLANTAALTASEMADQNADEAQIAALAAALMAEQKLLAPITTSDPALPIHVYVRAGGVDSNDGSAAYPVATMAGAWAKLPQFQTGPFVVHVGAGSWSYVAPPANIQRGAAAVIVIVGDGGGAAGADGFLVQASGTVASGSTSATLKTTGLTPGAFVGCTLEMLSGAAQGSRRGINDNNATDIRLCAILGNASGVVTASAGDTFRIVRPAASLVCGAFAALHDGHSLALVNVQLAGSVALIPASLQPQLWYGVELADGFGLRNAASLYAGALAGENGNLSTPAVYAGIASGLGIAHKQIVSGWGLLQPGASYTALYLGECNSMFYGHICSLGGYLRGDQPYARCFLRGGRMNALLMFYGYALIFSDTPVQLVPTSASGRAFNLASNSRITILSPVEVLASLTTQSAIVATGESVLEGISGGVLTINSAGTGLAVQVSNRAKVQFSNTITLTCAGQPFSISATASVDVVTLTAVGSTGSTVADAASLRVTNLSLSGATAGPALTVGGAPHVSINGALTLSAASPGSGALVCNGPVRFYSAGSSTITNTSTAPNSDGIRLVADASFVCASNPAITTSGSSGYGANCRGGGRFTCTVQPAGVVGPTADFTVGVDPGDDFADTALAASFAARAAGGAVVQRAA